MERPKRDVRISITADEEAYLRLQVAQRDSYMGFQSLLAEHAKVGSIIQRRDTKNKELTDQVESYKSDQARRRFCVDKKIVFWRRTAVLAILGALVLTAALVGELYF